MGWGGLAHLFHWLYMDFSDEVRTMSAEYIKQVNEAHGARGGSDTDSSGKTDQAKE